MPKFIFFIIFILLSMIFVFLNNITKLFFDSNQIKNKKKRLNKLRFDKGEDSEAEKIRSFINKSTAPFIFLIPPKYKNNIPLQKKLKIIEWDKYFTANQFFVFIWMLRFIGVCVFVFLSVKSSWIEGLIGFLILSFAPMFLLNNEYTETKKKILAGFPSIIKNLSCFLNADMSFVDAIRNTLGYTQTVWAALLEEFANDCEIYSYDTAIKNICNKLEIWEITDFFNMINLSLQKGINLKESFDMQSDRIDVLYRQSILDIINKRENMASLIQAPMLIGVIIAFAIPIVKEIMTFTSMVL